MKLKICIIVMCFIGSLSYLQAQDYLISFTGTGAATTVTSVKVENLTQGVSLEMSGADLLHLNNTSGIEHINQNLRSQIAIFPNPMVDYTRMSFNLPKDGYTSVSMYDISGREIFHVQENLLKGQHTYKIQGIDDGLYVVAVRSGKFSVTGKIISTSPQKVIAKISYENFTVAQTKAENIDDKEVYDNQKGISSEVLMQYNIGDRLKFTGVSSIFSTVIVDVPTASKSINFEFVPCKDVDGNNYPVLKIGSQLWMASNLKTTRYNNETEIPEIKLNSDWVSLSTPGYCWYNNDASTYKEQYGALYNFSAVSQGNLCPTGWHVPSSIEYNTSISTLGGEMVAGGMLKETGVVHWQTPNTNGTNISGFTALPAGCRSYYDGSFKEIGLSTGWWTSTATTGLELITFDGRAYWSNYGQKHGYSVRCIKDPPKNEEAYPGITGEIKEFVLGSDTLICELINGEYVFQGDIILTEDQLKSSKGAGFLSILRRWPDGIVYYEINENITDQSRIIDAISEYENKTLIDFIERTNQFSYVEFVRPDDTISTETTSLSSHFGMILGKQTIRIGDWAGIGEVIHEIGHTLGLIHEHCRTDRDDSIRVIYNNIVDLRETRKQYDIIKNTFFVEPFDFNSVMLYSPWSDNAVNRDEPVIVMRRTEKPYLYMRLGLSKGDITIVNALYSNQIIFNPNVLYGSFSDSRDNNVYKTVQIGNQVWMAENLRYLTHVGPAESDAGSWVYDYQGTSVNEAKATHNYSTYGVLYTLNEALGVCPTGWHLPSNQEWIVLENFLITNGYNFDGTTTDNKIGKALGSVFSWELSTNTGSVGNSDYTEKRNVTGFSGLPAGIRFDQDGRFGDLGKYTKWWSSTLYFTYILSGQRITSYYCRDLSYLYPALLGGNNGGLIENGFSVRCIKNN